MEEWWTSSAIADRLYLEICRYDETAHDRKYYVQALKYATRRAMVKHLSEFTDVITLYIQNFSIELREQIINLCTDLQSINDVVTTAVYKIIKSRAAQVYYEYLQNEPLRWALLEGDGNGKGDGSVIVEHVNGLANRLDQEEPEHATPIQQLAKKITSENIFRTTTDNEELFWYDGHGLYLSGQEWRIKYECQQIQPKIKTKDVQEVINHIKRKTFIDRAVFDSNSEILNLQNGLLDIHTMTLTPHSPDQYSITQLPVRFNQKAKCPRIIRFLGQVLKPKDVFTALELIGYCLYKTSKFEKAALCIGKGSNGKSTFLRIIDHLLGSKNISHISLQDISGDRFASAGLYGKLANTFADLKSDKLVSTGNFKMLVSGDYIRAQKKFQNPFEFQNYAKLIFSANEIPQSEDRTYAYFRRWIILFFEKVFEGDDNDTELINKLITPEELSGLLNLALIALRQLIKDNQFVQIDDIATIERDYNLNASTVERFLSEKCVVTNDREDYIICRDLWDIYYKFCKDNGLNSKTDNIFGMELRQLQVKKERLRIKKVEREYCYVGIRLKENAS